MDKKKLATLQKIYFLLGMSVCHDEMDCETIILVIPVFESYYDYQVTGDYTDVSFYACTVELCHDYAEKFFDLVEEFNYGTDSDVTIELL